MRPKRVSVTGVADSSPIPVDYMASNFGISVGVSNPSGNTFTVQHTFDDIYNIPSGSWVWHDHDTMAAKTDLTLDGNYAFPVRAIRLRSTVGAGTVVMTLVYNP